MSRRALPTLLSRHLNRGDYYSVIDVFTRTPNHLRCTQSYEHVLQACANIPDSSAARAVFRCMPSPTTPAAAHVVTALCRQHRYNCALSLIETLPERNIPIDHRVTAGLYRAATRHSHIAETLHALPKKPRDSEQRFHAQVAAAEAHLRAAKGRLKHVHRVWQSLQQDDTLKTDARVLASAVTAYIGCGIDGPTHALNVLMNWFMTHLRPEESRQRYLQNQNAMALLLTSATKAIAKAASVSPHMALSAYDAIASMELSLFQSSLPLTTTYFKVLQHARLPLSNTLTRIHAARQYHIQLDERAFSMALGAILRCDERLVFRLKEARNWISLMRSAAIPLTVHTYNLLAGQLRYCNDPSMLTALLSDMAATNLTPTAVTYGLMFSACVIPGDYSSSSRKKALSVPVWLRVLDAMSEHMEENNVEHTPHSRLSLARAYAHLGESRCGMLHFETYLVDCKLFAVPEEDVWTAFEQMMFNFAHCRNGTTSAPLQTLTLYDLLLQNKLPVSSSILDSLIVSCVRLGNTDMAVEYALKYGVDRDVCLSNVGMKHLMKALVELQQPEIYEALRDVFEKNRAALQTSTLESTVEELVIAFARCQRRDLCEEIMQLASIHVSDLDYIVSGREFLRFRKSRRQDAEEAGNRSPLQRQIPRIGEHADPLPAT